LGRYRPICRLSQKLFSNGVPFTFLPAPPSAPKKRYTPEEIVAKLRQVDGLVSQGQKIADAIRQTGVSEVAFAMSCATPAAQLTFHPDHSVGANYFLGLDCGLSRDRTRNPAHGGHGISGGAGSQAERIGGIPRPNSVRKRIVV
jgi:hypothetical protein